MSSNMNPIYSIARGLLIVALALSLLLSLASHGKCYTGDIPMRAASEILRQQAFEFWQQINIARQDPLAAAARLEIPEYVVRQTFADREWILEQGLPPLAWDNALATSAQAHGDDMFTRAYYSYVSPEGATYWDRIEDVGPAPEQAGETVNALFFENLISLEKASELLLHAILRDELTGNPSVECNIFSAELTRIGVGFLAGNTLLVEGQPYAYLLVADFARPYLEDSQPCIIGTYPQGYGVILHPLVGKGWFKIEEISTLGFAPAGTFQVPYLAGGVDLILIDNYGMGMVAEIITLFDTDKVHPFEQGSTAEVQPNRTTELGAGLAVKKLDNLH